MSAEVIPLRVPADTPIGSTHMLVRASSEDIEVVHVFGDVDLSNAPELELLLSNLSRQPHLPTVVVDLTGCSYVDSSILNLFVRAFRQLNDRFAAVLPMANPTRRIFSIVKLDSVLPLYENVADAALELGCIVPAL